MRVIKVLAVAVILLGNAAGTLLAKDKPAARHPPSRWARNTIQLTFTSRQRI